MESQTFTTLQPVSFENYDNFDNSECHSNQSQLLCNYFLGSATQSSPTNDCNSVTDILQSLDDLLSQPKDTFISKLLKVTNENTDVLEILRIELFKSAKIVTDFPYERSSLKRRLERRTKDGDSLSVKLARDCYVLKIASTGSFVNELNDVLTNKSTKTNTVNENSNLNDFPNVANLNINENISRIDRDLITLRGEYIQDSEFLNKAVTTISENNTKLNNVTTKHTSRLQNLQNQMNIIRDGKILKNHSLLEERLNAVENSLAEKSNLTSDVTQLSQLVSDLANSLADLKQGQQQHVKDITQMKASIKDLRQDVRNDSLRINTITDRRMTGVCALKAKVELINEKLKDNDPAYEHLETLVASCSKSVSDLRKKVNNVEKNLKSRDEKTFADVIKANLREQNIDCECVRQTPEVLSTNSVNSNTKQSTENLVHVPISQGPLRAPVHSASLLHVENSYSASNADRKTLNSNDMPQSKQVKTILNKSKTETTGQLQKDPILHKIPVHVANDANMVSIRENPYFQGSRKNRVDRYFVSGISLESTEHGMKSFLEENGIRYTFLRFFNSRYGSSFSAQLNVVCNDSSIVLDRAFWPTGIRVRRWIPKSRFNVKHENVKVDQYGNSDGD
ncbi:unnamed protein product [Mytilus edulis]|uniref:Uncharacterized protein n=1 Tax=Mytilus edulis TaxID=6550 RepID=A0A8S3TYY8_MYTED|nr:unnamed protein product [Mytilus edulis]